VKFTFEGNFDPPFTVHHAERANADRFQIVDGLIHVFNDGTDMMEVLAFKGHV
jgi:hypothetical protein